MFYFSIKDKHCDDSNTPSITPDSEVVEFKDESPFFGRRDSVLGVVFGLFGLLIILVSLFYVSLRVRRRQRRERIRRYLGYGILFELFPCASSQRYCATFWSLM